MRLYVRTLEEELPDWWAHHTSGAAAGAGGAGGEAPAANGVGVPPPAGGAPPAAPPPPAPPAPTPRSVAEVVVEGSWVSPYISSDKRPPPRYEHATALVGSELFIIGGNYGGCWREAGRHGLGLGVLPVGLCRAGSLLPSCADGCQHQPPSLHPLPRQAGAT